MRAKSAVIIRWGLPQIFFHLYCAAALAGTPDYRLGPALGGMGCDIWRFRGFTGPLSRSPCAIIVAQAWY